MAFTIPNQSDAGTSSQSEVDAVDFGILVAAYNGTGVVTGGAVTAQGTPDMTVAVAAGTVLINGLHYTISAGNGTISTADSSNPRFDLITINTSGAIVVTAGTAASNPVFPAIPADDAVLAAVHVPAGDTAIATAQIVDKRVIVKNSAAAGTGDDVLMRLGDGGDIAIVHRATLIGADAEVANITVGTSDHLGVAANSLVISNITTDGDIMFAVSDGGNSKGLLKLDGANGRVVVHGGDLLMSGAQKIYFFDVGGEYMESDGSTLTITGATALTPTVGSTAWANANHAHAASNSGGTLTTLGTVTTGVWNGTALVKAYIGADAIDGSKIEDNAIDSEHYTDGSIDNAHLADDAVDSDEIAAGAIDTAHIADNQVTLAKMAGITRGSIIIGDASGDPSALAKGTQNYVLTAGADDISWAAAAAGGTTTGFVIAMS